MRLRAAGVVLRSSYHEGMCHAFTALVGLLPEVQIAQDEVIHHLQDALASDQPVA